jgi:hypothetical protein
MAPELRREQLRAPARVTQRWSGSRIKVSRLQKYVPSEPDRASPNLEKQHRLPERAPVELAHRFVSGDKRARHFPELFAANPN